MAWSKYQEYTLLRSYSPLTYYSDLFSFYKEALEQDQANYINQYSRVNSKSLGESLDDLSKKLVLVIDKVRSILGEGNARDAWDSFVSGYTHFHLYCPRYKLCEIVPEYFWFPPS